MATKRTFKPNKPRGVNTARGVSLGRGRAAPKERETRRGGYVEYLRGMTGRNKSVPLTPEQFKKQGGL